MKNLTDYLFDKLLAAEEAKFEAEKRVIELETEREAAEQRIWELEAELHSATASNSVEEEQVCCSCLTRHACDANCPPKAYRMLEVGEKLQKGDEYLSKERVWNLNYWFDEVVGDELSSYPVGFYRRPTPQYRMLESGEEIKPGDEFLTHGEEWKLAVDVMPSDIIWTKDYRPFRRAI